MTHRALVERDASLVAPPNAYGGSPPAEWQTHIAAQPCFLYTRSMREYTAPEQTRGGDALRMLLPLGTDITRKDRINGVTDRNDVDIFTGHLNITNVLPHHTHLELELEHVT